MTGRIIDAVTSAGIAGAHIVADATSGTYYARSDADGRWEIIRPSHLIFGVIRVTIHRDLYHSVTYTVAADERCTVIVPMIPLTFEGGEEEEEE